MLLAINAGSFAFGFLYLKTGGAYLRLILGILMTTGLFFISYYKTSPYFFYVGMVLEVIHEVIHLSVGWFLG